MTSAPSPNPLASSSPPGAWAPLVRLTRLARHQLARFLRIEAASGLLLLTAATVALLWANSRWAGGYERLWQTPLAIHVGALGLERDLTWLVNDGLMTIFFFVVGLEIRSEIHDGELADWRRAMLPAMAAAGGMIAPALIYLSFAARPALRAGWAVPTATDIAFAVGVLTLLGKRVPSSLRAMILVLAIFDDIGAIIVIALFYSTPTSVTGFVVAALGLGAIVVMQRSGIRAKLAYVAPAVIVWAGFGEAGIHPSLTGVLVGLLTPARAWLGPEGFVEGVQKQLDDLAAAAPDRLPSRELAARLRQVGLARREAISPARSLVETLHPWVALGVMPAFALANAGVEVSGVRLDGASARVLLGVALGLLLGKPLGVVLATFAALRLRVAALPMQLGTRHVVVLGLVTGIGFTMALFVAQMAFGGTPLLASAKCGILVASGGAAILTLLVGRTLLSSSAARENKRVQSERRHREPPRRCE